MCDGKFAILHGGNFNEEDYYVQAVNFEHAANVLHERIQSSSRGSKKDEDILLTIPWIVLIAFSCELYLKSILFFEGLSKEEIKKSHNLKDLYDKIQDKSELIIKGTVEVSLLPKKIQFDSSLNKISRAFVEWRYCFEPGDDLDADTQFISALCSALKKHLVLCMG